MSEPDLSIEELSEFVKAIKERYELLNTNEKFKEQFKEECIKILLNPTDAENAALIEVDKGTISVRSVKNVPKENVKKEKLGWDSYMKTTRQIFKEIGDGTLSGKDIRRKVLARKIKVKGLKHLASLSQMSALTRGEGEQEIKFNKS
ncbi:MAG: hypothetical protein ACFE9I_05070 [Candidatus Hermodarchaeota archaeon]